MNVVVKEKLETKQQEEGTYLKGAQGYSIEWPIRGGSARKGYLFKASGIIERVGVSLVEVYERVGKSVTVTCDRTQKG